MRLVHLTDPHLTEPPGWQTLTGRSHYGKRYLGYASWYRKRRHRLRPDWLDELTAAVKALEPDQLIVTGDLTQIGTAEEIAAARGWLEALGSPDEVSLVPGNHDVYAAESWAALQRDWAGYLPANGPAGFPTVRRLGAVVVLGACSAEPTPPLSATGALGDGQLSRLEALLGEHRDALKVLALHHPPLPGMIGHRKRLRDAAALQELLARHPVDLILHGHRHRDGATHLHSPRDTRVFATAPASARPGSFRVIDVTADEDGCAVAVARHQRGAAGFEAVETERWRVKVRA